jgi:WD40 repeat protein
MTEKEREADPRDETLSIGDAAAAAADLDADRADCPKCGRPFNLKRDAGEVKCPHCGASLQAAALGETRMLGQGPRRVSIRGESLSLREFAGYDVEDEIGRGGVGVVYRAFDPELRRPVALKVLLSAEHASAEEIQRFYREASSAARLRHPNIVPIHELKVHEGKHYYTMDLIEGDSLEDCLRDKRLTMERNLRVMEKIARALHYAHTEGIVHRDLKPENVIIDARGEPQVTDFGLAKILVSDEDEITHAGLTRTGAAMGTPFYEAPEQAAGHSREVDPRTDVYACGCIIYEMITGAPPFVAGNHFEILRMQVEEEPIPPNRRGGSAPADVETICLKCLEKEPKRRYQTAEALAEDIRRFLDGEPIAARRASVGYVVKRKILRHRTVAAVVTLAVISVLMLTFVKEVLALALLGGMFIVLLAVWAYIRIVRERNEAVLQRDRAVTSANRERFAKERAEEEHRRSQEALQRLYFSNVDLAQKYVAAGDCTTADQLLDACPPQMRNWEWGRIKREAHNELLSFEGHTAPVRTVAVSPDGLRLATGGEDGTARIWDLNSGEMLFTLGGHEDTVRAVAFDPGGRILATAGGPTVRVWEIGSGELLHRFEGHARRVQALVFSPDGRLLASGGHDNVIRIWDCQTGEVPVVLDGHDTAVWSLEFAPDGQRLASGGFGAGSTVKIWHLVQGGEPLVLGGFEGSVFSLCFSPDGTLLASADWGGHVKIWDTGLGQEVHSMEGHDAPVRVLVFRPDGRRLVSGSDDRSLRTWDPSTGRLLDTFTAHADVISAFAYLPDARRVVLAVVGRAVKMWVMGEDPTCQVLKGHLDEIMSVAYSRDGKVLASGSADRTVKIWDPHEGRELLTLEGHEDAVRCVAFGADGKMLASGDAAGKVRLWDHRDGREILCMERHEGAVHDLAFDPEGRRLASAGAEGLVKVWAARLEDEVDLTLQAHAGGAASVAFSPDGTRLASSGRDGNIKLWDTSTGRSIKTFDGASGDVGDVVFSPCGRKLASVDRGELTVSIWDLETGRKLRDLTGHIGAALSVCFSPDGRRLVSGGYASGLKLWDSDSGRDLLSLAGHTAEIWSVTFSPDGRKLASCGRDQSIRVWLTEEWRTPESRTTSETLLLRPSGDAGSAAAAGA